MRRFIEARFLDWVKDLDRKPLLLRGARQVGKTYSIRELGKTFRYFAEINFDEKPSARAFFEHDLSARPLCEKLSAFTGVPVRPGETLLFLDEIQACPAALSALRFFQEQMPELHVVAAGSLLEFTLEKIPSLGVGRLTSLFMYPMTFREFLMATGDEQLIAPLEAAGFDHPLDEPFHRMLIDRFRIYALVGGMPAAVKTYAASHDLHKVMRVLDDLILTFEDDFSKYQRRIPLERLHETFRSVARQAGGKFICTAVNREAKSTSILHTLDLLVKAGLVHRVVHTHAGGLPLGAQADERRFKALLFDTGIHQRLLGLDMAELIASGEHHLVNRGNIAELFVGLHLVAGQPAHQRPGLYYWHREKRGANAEVDYVIQQGGKIYPVEVKAGIRGGMQSMRVFLHERGAKKGIRVALDQFGRLPDTLILPLYAIERLQDGLLKE
jgi:predicted AAA+ superfamily ATPase